MRYEGSTGTTSSGDSTGGTDEQESGGKRSILTGCLIVLLAGGVVAVLLMVVLGLFLVTGAASAFDKSGMAGKQYRFTEVTVRGEKGQPKVVQVPLRGFMTTSSVSEGTTTASVFKARLEKAREDDEVQAVLLSVNSGGGGVTASDIMHEELTEYRKKTGDPVVACFQSVAASGAYYVSAGADEIVAHPTAVTGSIGVMMALYDATGLMDKLGVKSNPVVSGKFKDMGSPFVEQSKEQDEAEREVFQDLVDGMYRRFVDIVAEGRGMKPKEVEKIADGRVFTSKKAKELGLVDSIGYRDDAISRLKKKTGEKNVHLVRYERVLSFSELVARVASGPTLDLGLTGGHSRLQPGQPMYLWQPPAGKK